jgi:hypothetical protein
MKKNLSTSGLILLLIGSAPALAQQSGEQDRIPGEVIAALESEDSSLRAAAVEQISDQALLAKLVFEDESRQVFYAAIDKLTDQTMLKRVALEHPWARGREFAVLKLTDQQLLADIAIGEDSQMVRRGAVYRLEDAELLKTIALTDRTVSIKREAVDRLVKLGEDSLLAEVAATSNDTEIRMRALENIDEAPPEQVAIADNEERRDPKPQLNEIEEPLNSQATPWTYSDGEDALRKADFDKAVAIFDALAASGDGRAGDAARTISELTEDDKTEWIIQQGAEAVRVADLDEGERLFLLAVARGHPLAPQLLEVVQQAKAEIAPKEKEIAALQAKAGFQCSTTLKMEGAVVVSSGGCPEGASQDLKDQHDLEVRAAIGDVQAFGFSDSAATIVTGGSGTSGSVVFGRKAPEPR